MNATRRLLRCTRSDVERGSPVPANPETIRLRDYASNQNMEQKMTTRCIILAIGILGLSAAHADEYVDNADSNGDGFVSLHELRAAYYADPEFNQRIEQTFGQYDRDGDGLISVIERRERHAGMNAAGAAGQIESGSTKMDSKGVANTSRDAAQAMNAGVAASTGKSRNNVKSQPETSERLAPRRDVVRRDVVETVRKDEPPAAGNAAITSRNESWIREMDTDNSGGASMAELIANGDGQKWFRESEFHAADKNNDGDLNATELAALIQGLERRQR